MVLLAAGLGGVFAGPILKILGEKIKKRWMTQNTLTTYLMYIDHDKRLIPESFISYN